LRSNRSLIEFIGSRC